MKNGLKKISIKSEDPKSKDASLLIEELSHILKKITGATGNASFDLSDLENEKACFLIARDKSQRAIGCGSIRPLEEGNGEIKRMYSKVPGIGSEILLALEKNARLLGYKALKLETRKINKKAVNFYLGKGYHVIDNYGKYIGNDKAICFKKELTI